jgi:hypothetical protein
LKFETSQDINGDVLMTATNDCPLGRKLPTRLLCERYGVVDRTINRWEKTGVIPQAEWINGRKYWDEESVEKRDRERMLAQTRKNAVNGGVA